MPPIGDKNKVKQFMEAVDEPMTIRRTRNQIGEIETAVVVEQSDDLTGIVLFAVEHGLTVRFDGHQIFIEEPPAESLPTEVTEEVP